MVKAAMPTLMRSIKLTTKHSIRNGTMRKATRLMVMRSSSLTVAAGLWTVWGVMLSSCSALADDAQASPAY
jgi:hypothetical protein